MVSSVHSLLCRQSLVKTCASKQVVGDGCGAVSIFGFGLAGLCNRSSESASAFPGSGF